MPQLNQSLSLKIVVQVAISFSLLGVALGQDLPQTPTSPSAVQISQEEAPDSSEPIDTAKLVSQYIGRLSDSSYRVRQIARSVIEQHPAIALDIIAEEIHHNEVVIGVQLVDMVSGLAMHSDLDISTKATELLRSLANNATSVGRGANNSLSAIADLQEVKAVEILTHYGAKIGIQDFSLNGKMDLNQSRLALTINEDFSGTDSELEWIRFLKSVQVVYLRGRKVSPTAVAATSMLKQLKAIRFHGIDLQPEQLLLFKEMTSLEHLGLSYVEIGDSSIPIISQLPITESIRLYGTKVTEAGKLRLIEHFEGLEIFRGSGGFLGISSMTNSTIVDNVTRNSAAQQAGILRGDKIVSINDVPVDNFDKLRKELAKYEAGEKISISIHRYSIRSFSDEIEFEPLIIQATLQEES